MPLHTAREKPGLGRQATLHPGPTEQAGTTKQADPTWQRPHRDRWPARGLPRLAGGLVERPRLLDLLDAAVRAPLTLVTGQAGAGKTVLLAAWAAAGRAPGPVVWVPLADDESAGGTGDTNGTGTTCTGANRLWGKVLAALRVTPGVPPSTLAAVQAELGLGAARDDGADGGADGDGADPVPVVLVLDDVPPGAPAVPAVLTRVLARHATRIRLVVATRVDPALPHLTRLRVSGEVADVRGADLAFSPAEAAELLGRHGIRLPEAELALLCRRTEGWAAGLRLAAMWLQQRPQPPRDVAEFAGTDRAVADYLVTEVLDRQPAPVRDLLLRTSVLSCVSGPLADALTGRDDGDRVLATLERTSTFVAASDAGRTWYRYHPLFAELLRLELRYRHGQSIPLLHARAAAWYAEHDRPRQALRHAVEADDPDLLADLLLRFGFRMVLDRDAGVSKVLARLPADTMRQVPALRLLVDLDALERGAPTGSWESLPTDGPGIEDDERLRVWSRYVAVVAAVRAGRTHDVPRLAATALERTVGDNPCRSDLDAVAAGALVHQGTAEAWEGLLDDADAHLHDGVQLAAVHDLAAVQLRGLAAQALVRAARGRLREAADTAGAALGLAADRGLALDPSCGSARLALAAVHQEWDDVEQTAQHLAAAHQLLQEEQRPVRTVLAIAQAQLFRSLGEPAAGRDQLVRARREAAAWGRPVPAWLVDWLTLTECGLHLAEGDPGAARALLDRVDGVRTGPAPTDLPRDLLVARTTLAQGEPARAAALLEPWTQDPRLHGPPRQLIEVWLLAAWAAAALGDNAEATRCLERSLDVADAEGYRRVFTEAGRPVRALLAGHLGSATGHRSFLVSLLDARSVTATGAVSLDAVPPSFERLTDRERAVLRYLPSRLSAGEIAAELHLSVHTVKSHLRHVYRKLGVASRREAVDRAHQAGLL